MLPRSCLRLADSKSNSSTRFPRTTTTRVSSGWVASMSILLAIDLTLGGASGCARSPPRRRSEHAGRTELWVETNGRQRAMRRARMRGPAAAHSVLVGHPRHDSDLDGATSWVGRDADARPSACCAGEKHARTAIAAAGAFRSSLKKASAAADHPRPTVSCGGTSAGSWLKLAGCPNAAEPEFLNRQQPLHRAGAVDLASRA